MSHEIMGLFGAICKPGVHSLSRFRLRLIEFLLGAGAEATLETMVASAQDSEAVRQDLFYIHTHHRPVAMGERELIYRLLRIGHSYGFRYHRHSQAGLTKRSFMCKRGAQEHYLGVDLHEWPRKITMELTGRCGAEPSEGDLQLSSEVDQPDAVAARFVELCEISLRLAG
jgi:hypothetical protein